MSMLEIVELVVADTPQSWRRAGFTVDDDGVARVGTVSMRLVGTEPDNSGGPSGISVGDSGGGIRSWAVRGIPAGSKLDGLATAVVESELAVPGVHANGAAIIDHVVLATADVDRTVATFVAAGCEPRRERLGGTESRPMRQVFVRAGEVILEIVGPPTSSEVADGGGQGSASFWGLAFTTTDLDACGRLLDVGLGTPRDAVQPGRRIATLRTERYGISVPTVFMS